MINEVSDSPQLPSSNPRNVVGPFQIRALEKWYDDIVLSGTSLTESPANTQDLTSELIAEGSREALIATLLKFKHSGTSVSTTFAQELVKRMLRDQEIGDLEVQAGGNPHDSLYTELKSVFEHLGPKTAVNVGVFLLDTIEKLHTNIDNHEVSYDFEMSLKTLWHLMYAGLDVNAPESLRLGKRLVDFSLRSYFEEGLLRYDDVAEFFDSNEYKALFFFSLNPERLVPIFRALANGYKAEHTNKLVGLFLQRTVLPKQINELRATLTKVDSSERPQIENLLRSLLCLVSGLPIWSSLDDLYKAIKFEEYPLTKQVETVRVKEMSALLSRLGIQPEDKILELGPGSGWLTGGLRQEGFIQIQGLDASERHVDLATQKYGPHFHLGRWENIPPELHGQKAIISKERDLPHTEDDQTFQQVLREVYFSLEEEGLFIFDMPNPEEGTYATTLAHYREGMKKFGYNEKQLANFWYIVDSPDGINFYNRFVPSREKIKSALKANWFEVIEEINEPMPDGNQNMVFVCRKQNPQQVVETTPPPGYDSWNQIYDNPKEITKYSRLSSFAKGIRSVTLRDPKSVQTRHERFWQYPDDQ